MRIAIPMFVRRRLLLFATLMFLFVGATSPDDPRMSKSVGAWVISEKTGRAEEGDDGVCLRFAPLWGTIASVERLSTESVQSDRSRRPWLLLLALSSIVAGLGVSPRPAVAVSSWSALFANQCCVTEGGSVVELEAGEIRWSGFAARNVGLSTWSSSGTSPVRLATAEPRGRNSPLFYFGPGEGAWLSPSRPAAMSPASVEPGYTAVFRFKVAPSSPGIYKEYFEPVADGASETWLGTSLAEGCTAERWCGAHLVYRVNPREPPGTSIVDLPESIAAGSPLHLTAEASDNTGIERVVAGVDGNAVTTKVDQLPHPDSHIADLASFGFGELLVKSRRSTFVFSPPQSCRWSLGDHTMKVQAYDHSGQVDQVSRTFVALADRDCDGVADKVDDCPTIAAPPVRRSGCPHPSARAARVTALYAAAGVDGDRGKNKITAAVIRGVTAGARVEVFCRPRCGRELRSRTRRDNATVKFPEIAGKIVPNGTRIVFRATMPRRRNIFGRQWTWRLKNGPLGPKTKCLAPGLAGHLGCG